MLRRELTSNENNTVNEDQLVAVELKRNENLFGAHRKICR